MLYRITVTPESYARVRASFARAKSNVGAATRFGVHAALVNLQKYIKQQELSGQMLKNRSGTLRGAIMDPIMDSVSSERVSGFVGVGPEAPYAQALNDGSPQHWIFPRVAQALAFAFGAVRIAASAFARKAGIAKTIAANLSFFKSVNHPGNQPYRFMETGLAATASDTIRIIRGWLSRALKGDVSG
jgi:hypothetical protein